MSCHLSEPGRVAPEMNRRITPASFPTGPTRPGSETIYSLRNLPTISEPLWPPKPKLLDMAMENLRWRA